MRGLLAGSQAAHDTIQALKPVGEGGPLLGVCIPNYTFMHTYVIYKIQDNIQDSIVSTGEGGPLLGVCVLGSHVRT